MPPMAKLESVDETSTQFHERMVLRCEFKAGKYHALAAKTESRRTRETLVAKATAEQNNAEHHRQKLSELEFPTTLESLADRDD